MVNNLNVIKISLIFNGIEMTAQICKKCSKSMSASENGSSLFSIMLCDDCLQASLGNPPNGYETSKTQDVRKKYEKPRFCIVLSLLANTVLALCLFFFFSQLVFGSKDLGFGITSVDVSFFMLIGGVFQYVIFEGISKALIYLSIIEKNTRKYEE